MDTKELIRLMRTRDDSRNGWTDEQLIAAAAAELERLAGIVERVQKTTDGVPVFPDDMVWFWHDGVLHNQIKGYVHGPSVVLTGMTPNGFPWKTTTFVGKFYSTKEAAELARQQDAQSR